MDFDFDTQRKALMARANTTVLIESLRTLDERVKAGKGSDHILPRAWVQDELERRFPQAAAVVAKAYEDAEEHETPDQVEILLAAIAAISSDTNT